VLLVGPPSGPLHPGRQPVHAHDLADLGHLRKALAKLVEAADEGPTRLAQPEIGQRTKQQVQAVADLRLADPDRPAGTPVRQPSNSTAATASRRTSNDSGRAPPYPWPGEAGSDGRPARRAPWRAATNAAGIAAPGPGLLAGVSHLADGLVSVNVRAHGASGTPSSRRHTGTS
jgi:hypothetical protein